MIAAIRIRGTVDLNPKNRKTLELLMLHKPNHMVLVASTKENIGMIEKIKDYITYGDISEEICALLLEKRGRQIGDKKLDKKFLGAHKLEDFLALAKIVLDL